MSNLFLGVSESISHLNAGPFWHNAVVCNPVNFDNTYSCFLLNFVSLKRDYHNTVLSFSLSSTILSEKGSYIVDYFIFLGKEARRMFDNNEYYVDMKNLEELYKLERLLGIYV